MTSILISLLFSSYISFEGISFLLLYRKLKTNGKSELARVISVDQNKKVNGLVPIVEITDKNNKKIKITLMSSTFSLWNHFDYHGEKLKVIYLENDLSCCIRDSKNEIIFIYIAMLFSYLFVFLSFYFM